MKTQISANDLKIFFGKNTRHYLNYWYARDRHDAGYDLMLMHTPCTDLTNEGAKCDATIGIYRTETSNRVNYQIIAPSSKGELIHIKSADIPAGIQAALDEAYVINSGETGKPIFFPSSDPIGSFIASHGGESKKKKARRFHWPAFFLGTVWMFYRKLYAPAIVLTLVTSAGNILGKGSNGLIFLVPMSAFPLGVWYAKRKIELINNSGITGEARDERIRAAGGTSLVSAIVYPLLLVVITFGVIIFWDL